MQSFYSFVVPSVLPPGEALSTAASGGDIAGDDGARADGLPSSASVAAKTATLLAPWNAPLPAVPTAGVPRRWNTEVAPLTPLAPLFPPSAPTPTVAEPSRIVERSGSVISGADAAAGAVDPAWASFGVRPFACPSMGISAYGSTSLRHSAASQPPAMLHEAVEAMLASGLKGIYVDAAFGRGMYSAEILRRLPPGARLIICTDGLADPASEAAVRELMKADARVEAVLSCPLGEVGAALAGRAVAGVVADLSVAWSNEDPLKGLSCLDAVPLDLRVSSKRGIPAAEWLRTARAEELAWVLHAYGEDDDPLMALRLAEALLERQRRHGNYDTVFQFVDVAKRLKGMNDDRGLHPARLGLQALRSFVNGELEQFHDFLDDTFQLLAFGARMVVVTARRSEAATVKSFMRRHEDWNHYLCGNTGAERVLELYPLLQTTKPYAVVQACQPLWPSPTEVGGRRAPRSLAAHVLLKVPRAAPPPDLDPDPAAERRRATGPQPRPEEALFREPLPLPFAGAG